MYWSWTLPWSQSESLLGILVANDVELQDEEGEYLSSLVSIGWIVGRVDFIFNKEAKEAKEE